jgi:hypothetical protein
VTEPIFNARLTDLASKIYVDLIRDAATRAGGELKTPAEAQRLAKLSFKLSQCFYGILDELNAENEPKNVGYTVQADDIAKWSMPTAKP